MQTENTGFTIHNGIVMLFLNLSH